MGILGNNFLSDKKREMEEKRPAPFHPDFGPGFCEDMVFGTVPAIM